MEVALSISMASMTGGQANEEVSGRCVTWSINGRKLRLPSAIGNQICNTCKSQAQLSPSCLISPFHPRARAPHNLVDRDIAADRMIDQGDIKEQGMIVPWSSVE